MPEELQRRYCYMVVPVNRQPAEKQETILNILAGTSWELVTVSGGFAYLERPWSPMNGNGQRREE